MTTPPQQIDSLIGEQILARDVSVDDYMEYFAADFAEYVDGVVIKMSPVTEPHDDLGAFLENVLDYCLAYTGGGKVLQAPMVMRTASRKNREPDLQVLLPASLHKLKYTYVEGGADLVIEIVSKKSRERDTMIKLSEYEQAGVKEYWILDQEFQTPLFYVLDEQQKFVRCYPNSDGVYQSTVLPQLKLSVALLWRDPLPNIVETGQIVQAMLKAE